MPAAYLILLILASTPCFAQSSRADRDAWLSLGLGPTVPGGEASPSGTFCLTRGPLALGGRFVVPLGEQSGLAIDAREGDVTDLSEVALLVGYRVRGRRLSATLSAGPAVLRVREWVPENAFRLTLRDRWAPGLALQAEVVVPVVGPLGAGVRGVADINDAASVAGLHGVLYLGRF